MTKSAGFTMLEVGGEGGSLRVVIRHDAKALTYAVIKSELALLDDPEDGAKDQDVRWNRSWDAALAELDRYQWARLYPLHVATGFEVPVLAAVAPRLEEDGHRDSGHWETWISCIRGEDNTSDTLKPDHDGKGDVIQWVYPSRHDPISANQA